MGILFFVVLPLATILISIVFQRLLKSPILVAILAFAIFLILAFTVFTTEFLINGIIYTIIAFITALIFKLICCLRRRLDNTCNDSDDLNTFTNNNASLVNDINGLQESINTLENNIGNLTNILSSLLNNNNSSCGCNRRIK